LGPSQKTLRPSWLRACLWPVLHEGSAGP